MSFRLLPHSLIGFLTTCGDKNLKSISIKKLQKFRFGHSVRRAFFEEDFQVNFSQRKNGFEIESAPGKKNMSVNLTSYEIKTGIKCFL